MINNLSFQHITLQKNKKTEWGELVVYFMEEINKESLEKPYYFIGEKKCKSRLYSKGFIASKIAHLKNGDDYSALYYLKSLCYDSKMRGKGFSVCFWSNLKVK